MRIFVTGGTGFLGSHFLNQAMAAGLDVLALRRPGARPRIALMREPEWIEGDLASAASRLTAHDSRPTVLVHFAAHGVSPQPCVWESALQHNLTDSFSMLKALVDADLDRAVVCGSCVEYGWSAERCENVPSDAPLEPVGPYAASKAAFSIAASALCRERKFRLAVLRPFTVFGEGQHESNFWPSLRSSALAGTDFPMTAGGQIRDFVPVEIAARQFLSVATQSELLPGVPVFKNVGTGRAQTLRAFAEACWKEWNAAGRILPGALPYRAGEVMRYVPSIGQSGHALS